MMVLAGIFLPHCSCGGTLRIVYVHHYFEIIYFEASKSTISSYYLTYYYITHITI